ncbi:MAG: hypothetical protein KME42_23285 [Tildeniella nuda ZEHNDER 1965/U140]|jgi:hypothetical protein|nr:hypothetical protein [Tildeniella nuda ZEHNDER 1965/U140]
MAESHFYCLITLVKKLLAAPKKAIGLMWLLSLGLHGLLLMLPTPSPEPPIAAKPVRVVSLSKQPVVLPTPSQAPQKSSVARAIASSQSKPLTLPAKPLQPPKRQTPKNQTPKPQTLKPSPPPVTPKAQPNLENAVADFSQLAKAQPGCKTGEDCWQVDDTQWRAVASRLTQTLELKGYQVGKLDDLDDDTGIGIYRVVASNGEKTFLHLLLTDRGTVYVLDPKQLTREQLEQRMAG